MHRISAGQVASDRVYQAIKARVIAYEFPQGERIYLDPIARAFGVSTTPVREAMNRLSAEGLVVKAPRRGFIAITLSEENLKEYYDLSRILLTHELESLDAVARRKLPEYEPIATALHRLKRRQPIDVSTLARHTGGIFAAIGSLRRNSQAIIAIRVANDHLYYIRTVECQHLEDVQTELVCLCELLVAGNCEKLVAAIEDYYNRRIELLPSLMAVARQ